MFWKPQGLSWFAITIRISMSCTLINQPGFDILQPTRDTPTYIIWFHDIQLCMHFLDDFPSGLRDISVNNTHVIQNLFWQHRIYLHLISFVTNEMLQLVNSSSPGQNDRHFAEDIFQHIFIYDFFLFRCEFNWMLFLWVRLAISQQWFR